MAVFIAKMILEIFYPAIIFLTLMLARLKRWIQSTVGLSSSEANAMIILLPCMLIIIFSEPTYRLLIQSPHSIDFNEQMILDSLIVSIETPIDSSEHVITLFNFNPNIASGEELKSLGIPDAVSKRIIHYRSKGGQFRVKSDLARIYGLQPEMYQLLIPFILLPESLTNVDRVAIRKEEPKVVMQYDLNLTDTSSLKSVKGIGTVLSGRIVKYREKLGGFINKNQVAEVYGMDSVTIEGLNEFFVSEGFQPKQVAINSVSEKELSNHPYISTRDARAIVTYRLQHGKFQQLNDLLKIKTLKESDVARFGHYLSFE